MGKSRIFYTDEYLNIENRILAFLNKQPDYLSDSTMNSPRAVGDAIQSILSDNFEKILGSICSNYSSEFARRAMADLAFEDKDSFYYIVDVKTHRLDTKFNMPNLTSVERLARFYRDDKNYFVVLMIDYDISSGRAIIKKTHFIPIEFLSWDCLTLGALGWGQIQIANSKFINTIPRNSRKKWMLQLLDNLFEFYPREIAKIGERVSYFEKEREYWLSKDD